jgi:hypothetical protein
MSYHTQTQLAQDVTFQGRVGAVVIEQANTYKNAAALDQANLALAVLRFEIDKVNAFVRLNAAAPGAADKVDLGTGSIDQSLMVDADLLSATQANWPLVAELYFRPDGSRIS